MIGNEIFYSREGADCMPLYFKDCYNCGIRQILLILTI